MGKLIGLLLLVCLPLLLLLSINVHTKNARNELARLAKGTIFLVHNSYSYSIHFLVSLPSTRMREQGVYVIDVVVHLYMWIVYVCMYVYRNLVNFRATNFSILIVRCGYSSRFRFTHEILSPSKKRQTIITYLPGHVNAY